MDKKTIVFDKPVGKKHSICYKTTQEDAAVLSIYIMRSHLGMPPPVKIKVTIEEI